MSPRIQSRNGAATVSGNGAAARDKTALAASSEQGNGTGNRALIAALVNSRIYREYEQAFTDLTGLPVALAAGGNLAIAASRQAQRESVLLVDVTEKLRVFRVFAGAGTAL